MFGRSVFVLVMSTGDGWLFRTDLDSQRVEILRDFVFGEAVLFCVLPISTIRAEMLFCNGKLGNRHWL